MNYTIAPVRIPIRTLGYTRYKHRLFMQEPGMGEMPPKLLCVRGDAPKTWRRAVYRTALMFRREFGYDFVGYGEDPSSDGPEDRAYLFLDTHTETGVTIGACSFRQHVSPTTKKPWNQLQWVWLHPYRRRQRLLAEAWPFFRSRWAPFFVDTPLSTAMQSFLEKQGVQADPHWEVR